MFMGPLQVSKPWATAGLVGVSRFLEKVWALGERPLSDAELSPEQAKLLHKTIKKVSGDTAGLDFNTAISQMMIFCNEAARLDPLPRRLWEPFVLLVAPYAPHLAEELWERLGHKESLARAAWPAWDEALCADDVKQIVVQVNGKIRERFEAEPGTAEAVLEARARALPKVLEWTEGKEVAKVVVVKDKLVNIVVKG